MTRQLTITAAEWASVHEGTALIDGLTDAGWWPDDTPEYVRTHEPELRPVGRRTGLTVTITIKERTP